LLVVFDIITRQVGQRGTFPHSLATIITHQGEKPRPPYQIDASRRSGRLFEMQDPLLDIYFILHSVGKINTILAKTETKRTFFDKKRSILFLSTKKEGMPEDKPSYNQFL